MFSSSANVRAHAAGTFETDQAKLLLLAAIVLVAFSAPAIARLRRPAAAGALGGRHRI